ncbi:MAG: hypothetical protein NTX96_00030, partial [Candidatus Zambryskibacteria bacterium]|nr:hypothetical protein [Candidatus Zambryskibacteria bacterium]
MLPDFVPVVMCFQKELVEPGMLVKSQSLNIRIPQLPVLTGYSKGYINSLCRDNKVHTKKINQNWFVDEESILNFKNTETTFDFSQNLNGRKKEEIIPETLKVQKLPKVLNSRLSRSHTLHQLAYVFATIFIFFTTTLFLNNPSLLSLEGIKTLGEEQTKILTASVINALNPLNNAGLAVYQGVNSFFDNLLYQPTSRLFTTSEIVTPTVVKPKVVVPEVPKVIVQKEITPPAQ